MSTIRLSAIGAAARVVAVVLGTLNLILVARVLGPQGRGDYVILLAALTVLTVVADAGLSMTAQSLAGAQDAEPAAMHAVLLRVVAPASLVVCALGVVIVVLGVGPVAGAEPSTLVLLLLTVPFALYARYWSALMIGLRRIGQSAAAQVAFAATLLALDVVLVVVLSGGVRGAVLAYLLASIAQAALMLKFAPRSQRAAASYPLRSMLAFGARSYPLTLASLAWSALPPFLVAHFAGAAVVGLLSVAQQLNERALLPVLALQDTAFQRMSSASREDAIETIQRYTRATVGVMVTVSLVLIIIAPFLVPFLFGAAFSGAIVPLQILLVSLPIVAVSIVLTPFLLAQFRDPLVISIVAWGQVAILVIGALVVSSALDAGAAAVILAVAQGVAAASTLAVFLARVGGHPTNVLLPRGDDARFAIAAIRSAYAMRQGAAE